MKKIFQKPKFIGIAGPSGSGKSSICKDLKRKSKKYEHIELDNYFKNPKTFTKKYGLANWESPLNLKFDMLLRHLKFLSSGKIVKTKSFPKKKGGKSKPIILKPRRYVLVEGFILFVDKIVRDFFDTRIYLDITPKLMLERRAIRFGADHVKDYDKKIAIPEYLRIGLIQKKFADFVINADESKKEVLDQVKKILSDNKNK